MIYSHPGKWRGIAKEIGAPAKRDSCHSWQVLTPRTMISNPVLGLERIASPSWFLLLPVGFFQTKVIHKYPGLFTTSGKGQELEVCAPVPMARQTLRNLTLAARSPDMYRRTVQEPWSPRAECVPPRDTLSRLGAPSKGQGRSYGLVE